MKKKAKKLKEPVTHEMTITREELEEVIREYLKSECRSTLRGKYFSVTSESGRKAYSEWLAGEIITVFDFMVRRGA